MPKSCTSAKRAETRDQTPNFRLQTSDLGLQTPDLKIRSRVTSHMSQVRSCDLQPVT